MTPALSQGEVGVALFTAAYIAAFTVWFLSIGALASMGLGAVNEIIEFSAVLMVPDTNVGGYANTALDLCFNALGAVAAMTLIGFLQSERA